MSNSGSIGKKLRKARQSKGVSIEDASAQTRIHHKVLKALEEDKFGELPSPTYVKGFLRRYAGYLGLDAGVILKEYIATCPKEPKQVLVLEAEKIQWVGLRRLIILVSTGVVILAVVSFGIYFIVKSVRSRPKVEKEVAELQEKAGVPAKTRRPPSKPEPEASIEPLVLSVVAKEDVWLQVAVDGEVIFQDILSPGDEESWKAEEKITLRVGNAGGIELELDGKSLGSPGAFGEMIDNIVLTKEGMRIERD